MKPPEELRSAGMRVSRDLWGALVVLWSVRSNLIGVRITVQPCSWYRATACPLGNKQPTARRNEMCVKNERGGYD